jgi:hypothetical protein
MDLVDDFTGEIIGSRSTDGVITYFKTKPDEDDLEIVLSSLKQESSCKEKESNTSLSNTKR